MLIYIIYFLVLTALAIEYQFNKFSRWPLLILLGIALALLAGLRGPYVSRDYLDYEYSFDTAMFLMEGIQRGQYIGFYEPGFVLIVNLLKGLSELNYTIYIMLVFAFASMSLKIYAMKKLCLNPFLALLFYFAHYFSLMEMTQIRIGLASALLFIAIIHLLRGNRVFFILIVCLACTFHYSAILYFVLLLFNNKYINRPVYLMIIIASVILAYIKLPLFDAINAINPTLLSGKLKNYESILKRTFEIRINVYNIIYITNVLSVLYLMFLVPKEKLKENGNLIFFMKCNILSIFLLSLLAGVPSIAFRMGEVFGVLYFFVLAGLVDYLPFRRFNILFMVLVAGLIFYINFFHNDIIQSYYISTFK